MSNSNTRSRILHFHVPACAGISICRYLIWCVVRVSIQLKYLSCRGTCTVGELCLCCPLILLYLLIACFVNQTETVRNARGFACESPRKVVSILHENFKVDYRHSSREETYCILWKLRWLSAVNGDPDSSSRFYEPFILLRNCITLCGVTCAMSIVIKRDPCIIKMLMKDASRNSGIRGSGFYE